MSTNQEIGDGKHAVLLLVRYVTEFRLEALYVHRLRLEFIPTVGMQFTRSGTNSMWISENGEVSPPKIQSVVYDLDEGDDANGVFVCSMNVDEPLTSSFWKSFEAGEIYGSGFEHYLEIND